MTFFVGLQRFDSVQKSFSSNVIFRGFLWNFGFELATIQLGVAMKQQERAVVVVEYMTLWLVVVGNWEVAQKFLRSISLIFESVCSVKVPSHSHYPSNDNMVVGVRV